LDAIIFEAQNVARARKVLEGAHGTELSMYRADQETYRRVRARFEAILRAAIDLGVDYEVLP
jgi:hypothetical protein